MVDIFGQIKDTTNLVLALDPTAPTSPTKKDNLRKQMQKRMKANTRNCHEHTVTHIQTYLVTWKVAHVTNMSQMKFCYTRVFFFFGETWGKHKSVSKYVALQSLTVMTYCLFSSCWKELVACLWRRPLQAWLFQLEMFAVEAQLWRTLRLISLWCFAYNFCKKRKRNVYLRSYSIIAMNLLLTKVKLFFNSYVYSTKSK